VAASATAAAAAAGAETFGDGASTLVWNGTNEPAPTRETPTGRSPGTARRRKGRSATKLGRRSGNGAGGKRGAGNRAGGKSSGESRSLANKLRAETRSTRPPPPRPATQGVWGTGKENTGNGGGFTPHSAMDGGPSAAARAVVLGGPVSEGLAGKSDNTFRQVQHPAHCVVATHYTGVLHGRLRRWATFALFQRPSLFMSVPYDPRPLAILSDPDPTLSHSLSSLPRLCLVSSLFLPQVGDTPRRGHIPPAHGRTLRRHDLEHRRGRRRGRRVPGEDGA
jgi:hypothetical protein